MQQTQDTPQPQGSQTQNQQNNSSSDITYESTLAFSTAALVKQQTRRYNQTVTVVLPTTEQIINLQKWNDLPIGELPATERRDVKGKLEPLCFYVKGKYQPLCF